MQEAFLIDRAQVRSMEETDRRVDQKPAETDTAYVAQQRVGLSEAVSLAEQVAQLEANLSEQHADVSGAVERRFSRATRRLTDREARTRTDIDHKRQLDIDQAQARRVADLKKAKASLIQNRQTLTDDLEPQARKQKRALDEATWLADSVLEAGQSSAAKKYQQQKVELQKQAVAVEAAAERAAQLVQWYRQSADDVAPPAEPELGDDLDAAYHQHRENLDQRLDALSRLWVRMVLPGARPAVAITLFCVTVVTLAVIIVNNQNLSTNASLILLASALGGSLLIALAAAFFIARVAGRVVLGAYQPVLESIVAARATTHAQLAAARAERDQTLAELRQQSAVERQAAEEKFRPRLDELTQEARERNEKIKQAYADAQQKAEDDCKQRIQDVEDAFCRAINEMENRYERCRTLAAERRDRELGSLEKEGAATRGQIAKRWAAVKQDLARLAAQGDHAGPLSEPHWHQPAAMALDGPADTGLIRLGKLEVDLAALLPQGTSLQTRENAAIVMPAALKLPEQGCVLIEASDHQGRAQSVAFLQMVMARILSSVPPGRARLTLIDPVGLGEHFAGFMHLADYDEKLIGGRVWTDGEQIQKRLADLTRHMENVLQKYLRNDFQTIDEYNEQAGELAEPYRFVVICDFPVNFSEEAARRLNSIITSGPRCGVFPLIFHDARHTIPAGIAIEDVRAKSVYLRQKDGGFIWRDDLLGRFKLTVDPGPGESDLNQLMDRVGQAAQQASQVEVPFTAIAPAPGKIWSADAAEELLVPMGRSGANRIQNLRLGKGMAQHVLIAGKTGSGKSTLLHALITSLAMWYSPDQVEFYLIDFKKGVEFKAYASIRLPHARAVAIESEREFGLSVLRKLDAELELRGDLFRQVGVQDLPSYRKQAPNDPLPRTMLIVDEFQELFSQDDAIAQEAALLLDRLVRQGRAFGVHVLLGSQTLGGSGGLLRSTLGQMNVRIALQCNESDSQLIFDDRNTAAQLLDRPGEAIYNDAGGMVEGNSPFQIAWLNSDERDSCLTQVAKWSIDHGGKPAHPIVFEGSATADLSENQPLAQLLEADTWQPPTGPPMAWLGEPITIKAPTAAAMENRPGANLLVVGQREEAAGAALAASLLSLAAHHPPDHAAFYLFDASTPDGPTSGLLSDLADRLPHETRLVSNREVESVIAEIDALCQRRMDQPEAEEHRIYLIIHGLQRYRAFRQRADSFGLSFDEPADTPATDQQFANLVREGAAVGIHLLVWCDTAASLDRVVDRQLLREFDLRALFQMSASDSSNLIDATTANQLGLHRALLYSEEQGSIEKFRPYALPDRAWLDRLTQRFATRHKDADALDRG